MRSYVIRASLHVYVVVVVDVLFVVVIVVAADCREAEQSARRISWNAFGLYLTLRGRLVQIHGSHQEEVGYRG